MTHAALDSSNIGDVVSIEAEINKLDEHFRYVKMKSSVSEQSVTEVLQDWTKCAFFGYQNMVIHKIRCDFISPKLKCTVLK